MARRPSAIAALCQANSQARQRAAGAPRFMVTVSPVRASGELARVSRHACTMTAAAPLATILAVLAVSSAPYERSLRTTLSARTGVGVTLVSCPHGIALRQGFRFTCHVRFSSGDRTPVRVRLTDASGHYSARLRGLLLRHLEGPLRRRGRHRRRGPGRGGVVRGG